MIMSRRKAKTRWKTTKVRTDRLQAISRKPAPIDASDVCGDASAFGVVRGTAILATSNADTKYDTASKKMTKGALNICISQPATPGAVRLTVEDAVSSRLFAWTRLC